MGGYWFKVYTELLEDPKYHRLSDTGKLGMFELMSVAKKTEEAERTGRLPNLDDICFFTRRPSEWWEKAIEELKNIEFIVEDSEGIVIRRWVDRQRAILPAERMRNYRKAKNEKQFGHEDGDDTVTNRNESVTESKSKRESKSKSIESEDTSAIEEISPIQRILEKVTGIMPSNINDIRALDEIASMNPSLEDVQAGFEWLKGQGVTVYHYSSLVNPVRVAIAKRVQASQQTQPKTPEKTYKPAFNYVES